MTKPTSQEMSMTRQWAQAKLGVSLNEATESTGSLTAVHQNWHICHKNRSIENTPLQIGRKKFARGLATHTVSEIIVRLPSAGKTFTAKIGRDQNFMVAHERTDIAFVVEVEGKEVFRSQAFCGGEPPVAISAPLKGARQFVLRVVGQADFGHGDWAEARVELKNGKKLWLDELPFSGLTPDLSEQPPFSFTYGGEPSEKLLGQWQRQTKIETPDATRTRQTTTWRDPRSGLLVTCEATAYSNFPATEYVLYFKNTGPKDTPILENVRTLDARFSRAGAEAEMTLFRSRGSDCKVDDFEPIEQKLEPKQEVTVGGVNGRSSTATLPFLNVRTPANGVMLGVGWSGQWTATLRRDEKTNLDVQAGLERVHTVLQPGEKIRMPRMLLLFWQGEAMRGHNLLRQFILAHHTPQPGGRQLRSPIAHGNWGMLHVNEHLKRIRAMLDHNIPFEYYWIDAGWYGACRQVQDWWNQAGNWFINRDLYPDGFRPISDLLHKHGKKFLLWFDPERAYRGSQIHREHPEWVVDLGEQEPVMLVNLGIDEARRWVTDHISRMIEDEGIDIYRHDSNIDPLPYWNKIETPDRVGMAEIRHIEGLYAFWDALLERHPNLVIDNCSSGGRRIDLETTGRSIPLWQSDLQCCPWYNPMGSQTQNLGLSHWVPLHSTGANRVGDEYDFRSAVASGFVCNWAGLGDAGFPYAEMKRLMEEVFVIRDYHYGDLYPLTSCVVGDEVWLAYQLDRPDLKSGIVLAFRRKDCPYPALSVQFRSLKAAARYKISYSNGAKSITRSGRQLMEQGLEIRLDQRPCSVLIRYAQVK